jgi:uncharacterized protein (DUF2384 family)
MATPENVLASIVSAAHDEATLAERLAERLKSDPRLPIILAKGIDTFEDAEQFGRWLRSPSRVLNRSPMMCLVDGDLQSVEDELARIEYGVF